MVWGLAGIGLISDLPQWRAFHIANREVCRSQGLVQITAKISGDKRPPTVEELFYPHGVHRHERNAAWEIAAQNCLLKSVGLTAHKIAHSRFFTDFKWQVSY
jgi:hypothetical protein